MGDAEKDLETPPELAQEVDHRMAVLVQGPERRNDHAIDFHLREDHEQPLVRQAGEGCHDVKQNDGGVVGLRDGERLGEAFDLEDVVEQGTTVHEASLPGVDQDGRGFRQRPIQSQCEVLAVGVG